jgi:site-specific DNA recombinase
MRERLQRQLGALDQRLAELEATPAREGRFEWRTTGGTFGEARQAEDTLGRRDLLQRSGITFTAQVIGGRGSNAREFHIRVPDAIRLLQSENKPTQQDSA